MKRIAVFVFGVGAVLVSIYKVYFMIMPQVVVENFAGERIKLFEVVLPSNKLNFGTLEAGSINAIYYSLDQADGTYRYRVVFYDDYEKTGECGDITKNELGKTYKFTILSKREVSCNA